MKLLTVRFNYLFSRKQKFKLFLFFFFFIFTAYQINLTFLSVLYSHNFSFKKKIALLFLISFNHLIGIKNIFPIIYNNEIKEQLKWTLKLFLSYSCWHSNRNSENNTKRKFRWIFYMGFSYVQKSAMNPVSILIFIG